MTLPTLKEELDRKSFKTVEWLYSSLERGRITPAQFSTGLDALFMAVSGITDDGVVELITAGTGAASKEVARLRRVFIKGEVMVALTWVVAGEDLEVAQFRAGARIGDERKPMGSPVAAREALNTAAFRLLSAGYDEV